MAFFPVSKSNATPPEKRSDIIKLLKINGSNHMATKMAIYASNQVIDVLKKNEKELTPRTIEIIREENSAILKEQIADDQAFFSYLIPIYEKYYMNEGSSISGSAFQFSKKCHFPVWLSTCHSRAT